MTMKRIQRSLVAVGLTAILAVGTASISPATAHADRGFNDRYVFVTTRSLTDSPGMHPALKATLFPVTVALDAAFLPFAVVAGFVD
jgi:hypothetical protein